MGILLWVLVATLAVVAVVRCEWLRTFVAVGGILWTVPEAETYGAGVMDAVAWVVGWMWMLF